MRDHEAKVRALAETPLAGPVFRGLIQRWEMNNEPPPPDAPKVEKCMPCLLPRAPMLTDTRSVSDARTWGHGRAMEAEEEDYFAREDDDAPAAVVRILAHEPLKRKRAPGLVGGPIAKFARRPPRLVEYAGEDELPPSGDEGGPPSTSPSPAPEPGPSSPAPETPPASPRLAHTLVPPPRRANGLPAKRRRPGEADEDEGMERLVAKRRPSGEAKKEDGGGAAGRKMQVKLAAGTHPGAKDGDTG